MRPDTPAEVVAMHRSYTGLHGTPFLPHLAFALVPFGDAGLVGGKDFGCNYSLKNQPLFGVRNKHSCRNRFATLRGCSGRILSLVSFPGFSHLTPPVSPDVSWGSVSLF